jgi:hypothetical protein
MKIELQITSPDTSDVLRSLGVKVKSDYMWQFLPLNNRYIVRDALRIPMGAKNLLHAYNIAELGIMIPWGFFQSSPVHKLPGGLWMYVATDGTPHHYVLEVEARAHYLINLIMTKQVTVDEVNNSQKYDRTVKSKKE